MRFVGKVAIAVAAAIMGSSAFSGGTPVVAVPATPVARVPLPAAIDTASFYEKQTVCQSIARPGAVALGQLLQDTYGPATVYITRACTSNVSEHFDGRAVDWMRNSRVPAEREQAEAFLAWVLAPGADGTPMEMARRLGIMYLIWNNRMIRSYDPGRGWTDYRGCLSSSMSKASLDTTCHRNHIHISLSWDGAAAATSWWTGAAITAPYCSDASTPGALPAPGDPVVADPASVPGLVPIEPVPVLDTATGAGLPRVCRLLAGRTQPVSVLPAIAGTQARVVALRITVRSNAPARLAVWSSGQAKPTGQIETPIATDVSTTVLVPVSSKGTVGVATSLGASNVQISVVGYLTTNLPGASGSSFAPPGSGIATAPAPVHGPAGSTPATTPAQPAPEVAGANQPTGVRAGKPGKVAVRATKGAVAVSWAAPTSTGTHPILGYRVAALFSPTQTVKVAGSCATDAAGRGCRVTGLKRGRTYWMSVRVTTAAGSTWAPKKKVRAR